MTSSFASHFFSESKFRELDNNLILRIKRLVSSYNTSVRHTSKSEIKLITSKLNKNYKWFEFLKNEEIERVMLLDSFKIKDLQTDANKIVRAFVAFGATGSAIARYDRNKNTIILFYENANTLTDAELESAIIHEIVHGAQQYKTTSPEYDEQSEKIAKGKPYNKTIYFSEPSEFDAHISELGHRIQLDFNNLLESINKAKLPETKKIFEAKMRRFLLELSIFIKADINSYLKFKELPLPQFFSTHDEFLTTISKNSALYKKLKQKLANLYVKLSTSFS